ncbi:hypothetical protein HPB48_015360 [Haemaphysalis longicornis]|uniref:Uncharacterized protein n=1 Tax=Haemaphysalis longicornis TaxID=44386 RepID=A0A9J6GI35_HAELO|nr:hypothetical protein HPB48_015360 [Haemaphysalis longicornis]
MRCGNNSYKTIQASLPSFLFLTHVPADLIEITVRENLDSLRLTDSGTCLISRFVTADYIHPYAANNPLPEPQDIAPTAELTLLVTKILAAQ